MRTRPSRDLAMTSSELQPGIVLHSPGGESHKRVPRFLTEATGTSQN